MKEVPLEKRSESGIGGTRNVNGGSLPRYLASNNSSGNYEVDGNVDVTKECYGEL